MLVELVERMVGIVRGWRVDIGGVCGEKSGYYEKSEEI